MAPAQLKLPIPAGWSAREREAFLAVAASIASSGDGNCAIANGFRATRPGPAAAMHILNDLARQGWKVRLDHGDAVFVIPPDAHADPRTEKDRIRQQELLKRDEQLSTPSVRRFIADMERP